MVILGHVVLCAHGITCNGACKKLGVLHCSARLGRGVVKAHLARLARVLARD